MEKETKKERFRRVAEKRTNSLIRNIRIMGNCSNRSAYEYSREEVDKIFNAIIADLKEVKNKFKFKNENKSNIFKL